MCVLKVYLVYQASAGHNLSEGKKKFVYIAVYRENEKRRKLVYRQPTTTI